jgi:RhtB (resistance to homoserine/threonine) family protein
MSFWHGFMVLTFVHLLAAASPGPDFALVTRESMIAGRRAGLLTSVGIALGLAVHISYSAAGLAALIAHSDRLLLAVKTFGAGFLFYLGVSALRVEDAHPTSQGMEVPDAPDTHRSSFVAKGFFCNLLNPKAPLYFVALFTAVIPSTTPTSTLVAYGTWLVILQWLWFALVATVFSHERIRDYSTRARTWIERFFGVAMIALAARLAWSAVRS